jgi:hypothetical protein
MTLKHFAILNLSRPLNLHNITIGFNPLYELNIVSLTSHPLAFRRLFSIFLFYPNGSTYQQVEQSSSSILVIGYVDQGARQKELFYSRKFA